MLDAKLVPLPPVGLLTSLAPWLCWNLWKARNKLLFDGISFTCQEILLKAIKDAKEWQEAHLQNLDATSSILQDHLRPHDPRDPIIVSGITCHVDAAWNPVSRTCGIGGIFQGAQRHTTTTINFSCQFISSALMAEAIAVRSAVMDAAASNIRSLTVLSDSQVLIAMLKTKESRPALFGITFDIYHFSNLFDSI